MHVEKKKLKIKKMEIMCI